MSILNGPFDNLEREMQGDPELNRADSFPTGKLAYTLSSQKFRDAVSASIGDEGGESSIWTSKGIIGFKFSFDGDTGLSISTVIYGDDDDETPVFIQGPNILHIGSDNRRAIRIKLRGEAIDLSEGGDPESAVVGSEGAFRIEQVSSIDSEPELDFYDISTEFVFFTVDQLRPLVDNFADLIITGNNINYGKVIFPYENDGSRTEPYFSLKIEVNPDSFLHRRRTNGTIGTRGAEGTEIPASLLAIGHPCPDAWQPFSALTLAIANVPTTDSALVFQKLSELYNSFKHEILKIK